MSIASLCLSFSLSISETHTHTRARAHTHTHKHTGVGPVVAYIDAYRSLMHYKSGVYNCPQPSECTALDPEELSILGIKCPLKTCNRPECKDSAGKVICDDCYLGGHAVSIVGWGQTNTSANTNLGGQSYWVVKNSWGMHFVSIFLFLLYSCTTKR